MGRMLFGLILFFGVHAVPWFPGVRLGLIGVLGRVVYTGLFAAGSLTGLAMMVQGYRLIEPGSLWAPMPFARHLALAVMPVALILTVAAYLPTLTKRRLRHPMLIGVALWALVHLLANGDLASTLIFAPFLAYALLDILLSRPRKTLIPSRKPEPLYDLLAVIVGLIAYGALLLGHGTLFGVSLLS